MANNSSASYKLVLRGEQRQQLRTWAERAAALERVEGYLAVLRTIYHQLTTDPLGWGDPWYHLSQLDLQVCHRACTPLHVSYAVDAARRVVYVRKLTLFSGSGLEEGE
jgi:hypothetical protein